MESIAPTDELVDLYEGLGHALGRLNRYQEASASIKKAVELLEGESFAPRRSHLVKVGAHLAFDAENWAEACEAFTEAAQIDEVEGETFILAEDLFNLGSTHIELSQYDEALSCYERAATPLSHQCIGNSPWIASESWPLSPALRVTRKEPKSSKVESRRSAR